MASLSDIEAQVRAERDYEESQWLRKKLERYMSRKFATMIVAQVLWVVLLAKTMISSTEFIELTKLTIGGYFVANVFHYLSSRLNKE